MGRIGGCTKRGCIGLLVLLLLVSPSVYGGWQKARAGDEEWQLEQAMVNAPHVKTYITNAARTQEQWDVMTFQATLGERELQYVGGRMLQPGEEGVAYTYMVDTSQSMKKSQMKAIKRGLRRARTELREMDRFALMEFGGEPVYRLQGSETLEQAMAAIDALDNKKLYTPLYDAIDMVINKVGGERDVEPRRKVIIVVTDGSDYDQGGVTYDEILRKIGESNIPIYGVAPRNRKRKEKLDKLGILCRESSAELRLGTDKELDELMRETVQSIVSCYVIEWRADSNNVGRTFERLQLQIGEGEVVHDLGKTLMVDKWMPDDTIPRIKDDLVEKLTEDSIGFTFNEPVLNAGDLENYIVKDQDGKTLALKDVTYEDEGQRCEILFEETVYSGDYTLEFAGVTDDTMERNKVEDASFHFEGRSPTFGKIGRAVRVYWWVVAIAALAIVMACAYFLVKKQGGIVKLDGKMSFGSNIEQKLHMMTSQTRKVKLVVTDRTGSTTETSWNVDGSIFVGRSSICNLYFDDDGLSRQHFVIEATEKGCFLSDLDTTNGTFINGVRVYKSRQLSQGDVITAGREKIVFLGIEE